MKTLFWYKTCPFCGQGRLFVYKNIDSNKLYLHCEECETGYNDPERLDKDHSFLTLLEDFNAIEASQEDILQSDWKHLNFNSVLEKG
jgi:uncharacterized protein (DUF983 family)